SDGSGNFMAYGVPGYFLNSLAPMVGTPLLEWVRRFLNCESLDWKAFEARMTASGGPQGLPLTLPYFSPSGERAPFTDPHARGSIHGLTVDTEPEQFARSVYAGVAGSIAECCTELDIP